METIDVRGLACPTPLILTKRALLAATENTDFEIICNNEISLQNLKNYLRELGISYKEIEDEKKEFHLFFSGIEGGDWIESQETECMENDLSCKTEKEIENTKSKIGFYVVVIKSLQMGSGDPKLGDVLLKAYLNALPEIDTHPLSLCFYNEGVKWVLRGSPVLDSLQKLEKMGVKIYLCGTCIDYYGVKEKVAVGTISNMFTIANVLAEAGSVIYL